MTTPQTVIATWLMGVAAQFARLGIPFGELEAGLGTPERGLAAPTRQLLAGPRARSAMEGTPEETLSMEKRCRRRSLGFNSSYKESKS